MHKLKQYSIDFFNLIFPDLCNACGQQLYHGEQQICTACLYDLPYTDFHVYAENAVAKLFYGRIRCQWAMAMLYFRKGTKAQRLVHQLKYRSQPDLGFRLGALLGEKLAVQPGEKPDLIIPVPLHPKKERSRGYNQSRMIADGISSVLHIPVGSTQLNRLRATGTQTKRNRYDRYQNMQSVFSLAGTAELRGKHVLLVDDVITTGATLEACGQVLLEGGVAKLSIAALAFAE
ncbi:comF family protein [Pedobacter westerhofensis]|uniref:ComF family protein n=1 Tax=Pedobacter westerhofensis TaxID=425512 RepID=A0A521C4B0_9SPHI|nr:ComF family protein [Pedobacter westerhofensis]SMO54233.1 comF family protein [Pedobacter westerhofensis]